MPFARACADGCQTRRATSVSAGLGLMAMGSRGTGTHGSELSFEGLGRGGTGPRPEARGPSFCRYLQTKDVTVVAASEAEKVPPVTVTGVPAAMLALDEVTFGVHEAGAVV